MLLPRSAMTGLPSRSCPSAIGKVARLRLPVLYVHGTADDTVPLAMGRRLFEATPTALGFVAVEQGGHDDNAQRGGATLRGAIADFVARATGAGTSQPTLVAELEHAQKTGANALAVPAVEMPPLTADAVPARAFPRGAKKAAIRGVLRAQRTARKELRLARRMGLLGQVGEVGA